MMQAVKVTTEKPQMVATAITNASVFTFHVARKKIKLYITISMILKGRCPIVIKSAFLMAWQIVHLKCAMIGKT